MTAPSYTVLQPGQQVELCPTCGGVGVHALPRYAMGHADPVSTVFTPCRGCGGSGRVVAALTPYVPPPMPTEPEQ